ncbi:unnamed protein product [Lactuca saligna]|uniref:Uncharacterized protein n=1 Tax=Lactuca saligna TaxID=75948 RepID=A0AA35YTI7_LACSI|nr:unnamed protein product [Lactuca saligna]
MCGCFAGSFRFSLIADNGKKNKQDQSAQKEMNDYEKNRLLRIKENQARLKDLGVKSIANSLTSLVESQKPKKKQVKPTYIGARDSDYIPDLGDDIDGDYHEVARSVQQHRPQYIAPMSMNRLANLTRQRRVIAPNVSNKYPLVSNATKEKQSRSKTSMGDLILRNKGPQREREVFKQNAEKHNCIISGATRQLALVDEDEDDEISQADMEQFGLKDNVNEGRLAQCEEDDVDQNDDHEDMDHLNYANIENEIEVDDSDDDLGNEDDVLFEEQLEEPQLEKETVISTPKKRGPTMLHSVHTRNVNQREVIICNEYGQPVGPIIEGKDVVGKFSRFLGTIARTHSYAPLTCTSWHKVPHKDKIWEYVLGKYDVPDDAKTWVLRTIGNLYKVPGGGIPSSNCQFHQSFLLKSVYPNQGMRDMGNVRDWMYLPRRLPEFESGVIEFLNASVPRDIYDLKDESSETIGDSYWSEPNEDGLNSFAQVGEHEIQLSRHDMPPLVVDANTNLDGADEANSDSGGDSDYDDTLWDWMEAEEDEAH